MAEVAAIILAAGKGSRIGGPKWQLACRDKTFLDTILDTLETADIQNIACVVTSYSMPSPDSRMTLVINPTPEKGMFSSVYCGILNFPGAAGYLIMPVDHPLVTAATIKHLVTTFNANPTKIIRPVHDGKAGHPVIIPRHTVEQVLETDIENGLKAYLQQQNPEILDVQVADSGVLNNINDLKALYGCRNIHRDSAERQGE